MMCLRNSLHARVLSEHWPAATSMPHRFVKNNGMSTRSSAMNWCRCFAVVVLVIHIRISIPTKDTVVAALWEFPWAAETLESACGTKKLHWSCAPVCPSER
eukprot:2308510-Amphidinium_carterae.2